MKMCVISLVECLMFRSSRVSAFSIHHTAKIHLADLKSQHELSPEWQSIASAGIQFFFNLCILIFRCSDETSCLDFWKREIVYHLSIFSWGAQSTDTSEKRKAFRSVNESSSFYRNSLNSFCVDRAQHTGEIWFQRSDDVNMKGNGGSELNKFHKFLKRHFWIWRWWNDKNSCRQTWWCSVKFHFSLPRNLLASLFSVVQWNRCEKKDIKSC